MPGLSRGGGINQVYNGLRHVVILGAGASIASSLRNPEPSGKPLPSMDNFVTIVGLEDILENLPPASKAENFESLYGKQYAAEPNSPVLREIEKRIQNYFNGMVLPEEPTIYDFLMLSLRSKDIIATFNWDPFLYQAFCRISKFTKDLPQICFLHGCVSIGYCEETDQAGPAGYYARRDGGYFEPTKLLYPVEQKNYTDDKFISGEWKKLKFWMAKKNKSVRATIFGYGAPVSDVEAVSLLNEAWGTPDDRDMEQFEIIDVAAEEELRQRWNGFIHSHHYDVVNDYFESSLALNPRRSCESYESHINCFTIEEAFRNDNPIPNDFKTLKELWEWHSPLFEAEQRKGR